ncbi:MAG: ATP-binding protein [Dehalococcoidia bacterium]
MRTWLATASALRTSKPLDSTARSEGPTSVTAWLLPPYRAVEFWVIQALVLIFAIADSVIEGVGLLHFGELYFVVVSLFFIPTIFAAVKFGFRGSMATAVWCTVISMPNTILWHSGLERLGVMCQMYVITGIAAFAGYRVDRQMEARARAEETSRSLESSELKYRRLFESAGEGILVLDRSGRVVECNPAAAVLLQCCSVPEALRKVPLPDVEPGPLASALLDIPRGHGQADGIRVTGPDGRDIWLELVCTPLSQRDGLTQVVLRNVTEQKRRQTGFQTYAAQILHAQEEERQRIAQELHDETVQSLILLCRKLDDVKEGDHGHADSAWQEIREARAHTESIVESLRGFIRGLRPPILDDLGLAPALRKLLTDLSSRSSIDTRLDMGQCSERLPADAELALFRIAQEALHNVDRHSHASRVRVRLDYEPGRAKLVVSDDGTGFPVPAVLGDLADENKLGLLGMQERARILGGHVAINSALGSGTEVIAEIFPGASRNVPSDRGA